jgi:hypothetical protein
MQNMIVLCLDDIWMQNMIYDGFVSQWHLNVKYYISWVLCLWWSFNAKIIYDGFVPCCLWNEKYYIWRLCISMTLECEQIYLMVLNLETLHEKYDGFMSQWPFNAEQYIYFFPSMTLGREIWHMMVGFVHQWKYDIDI